MSNFKVEHGYHILDKNRIANYRDIVEQVVSWFVEKYSMNIDRKKTCKLKIHLRTYDAMKCWGEVHQKTKNLYTISVATDQSVRDFIATLMHELVHVLQWERGKWKGDGEKEAIRLQYKLADKFWKDGRL